MTEKNKHAKAMAKMKWEKMTDKEKKTHIKNMTEKSVASRKAKKEAHLTE